MTTEETVSEAEEALASIMAELTRRVDARLSEKDWMAITSAVGKAMSAGGRLMLSPNVRSVVPIPDAPDLWAQCFRSSRFAGKVNTAGRRATRPARRKR